MVEGVHQVVAIAIGDPDATAVGRDRGRSPGGGWGSSSRSRPPPRLTRTTRPHVALTDRTWSRSTSLRPGSAIQMLPSAQIAMSWHSNEGTAIVLTTPAESTR